MKTFTIYDLRFTSAWGFESGLRGSVREFSPGPRKARAGFTKLELCALLAALTLVIAVTLPALAEGRSRTGQLTCLNNLRQIGRALLIWEAEHGYSVPWRTDMSLGGTYLAPGSAPSTLVINLRDNPWFQFSLLSNSLASARVLACPSDTAKPAQDFSTSPDGGLLNPNYRNRSISYFLSLDAACETGKGFLSGDRNIGASLPANSCSSQIRPTAQLPVNLPPASGWRDNAIHGSMGNVLFHDGQVRQLASGPTFVKALSGDSDGGVYHLLVP